MRYIVIRYSREGGNDGLFRMDCTKGQRFYLHPDTYALYLVLCQLQKRPARIISRGAFVTDRIAFSLPWRGSAKQEYPFRRRRSRAN